SAGKIVQRSFELSVCALERGRSKRLGGGSRPVDRGRNDAVALECDVPERIALEAVKGYDQGKFTAGIAGGVTFQKVDIDDAFGQTICMSHAFGYRNVAAVADAILLAERAQVREASSAGGTWGFRIHLRADLRAGPDRVGNKIGLAAIGF